MTTPSDRIEPLNNRYRITVTPSRHRVDIVIRGDVIETNVYDVGEFCDPTLPIIRIEPETTDA